MEKEKTMIIFGGGDFEEQAARAVVREAGLVIATATVGGAPVHGGNAYKADGFRVDEGDLADAKRVIIFECSPDCVGSLPVSAVCDHHNPGDPGWGKGAAEYWEASSLGQLCTLLGAKRTRERELVAAGDHCPAAAYAGQCAGIGPAEFLDFRIQSKVAFYRDHPRFAEKSTTEIRAAIKVAQSKLKAAPIMERVRDLRGAGHIDELPEAALSMGEAYMASLPDIDRDRRPTGNTKIVIGGHVTPEAVTRFMEWGNSLPNRLGDAYGNPARGFAGVVVRE